MSAILKVEPGCEVAVETALGAALLAGIGVGLYASKEEAASMVKPDLTFLPQMDSRNRDLALYGWHRAVERAQNWVEVR